MKRLFSSCGGFILVLGMVLSSCGREHDFELKDTYDDYTGLSFTLNDSVMHGCTLKLYTDNTEYARIEVEGAKVDLNGLLSILAGKISIPGGTKAAPKTSVVSTCVLPGSPMIVIDKFILKSSNGYRFSGNGKSDNCTFYYSGRVLENGIEFRLSDVKMKNELPLPGNNLKVYSAQGNFINVNWQYMEGKKPETAIGDLLNDGFVLPMLSQLLVQKIQGMTVYKGGDVTLALADHETKRGLAQYVVCNGSDMRIYLNVPEIVVMLMTRADAGGGDIDKMIKDLIPILSQYLAKMVNDGILVHYSLSTTGMSVTLDSATVIRIMNLLSLALSDEVVINMLQGLLEEKLSQEMRPLLPMIMGVIKALPANLEVTEKLDVSFNFSLTPVPVS